MISATDRASATSDGAPSGAYRSMTAWAAAWSRGSSQPVTTRFGRSKSSSAWPSRMNSGLVTIDGRSRRPAAAATAARRPGPSSGSVERTTITWSDVAAASRRATAASTLTVESGPSASVGVLTQTNVNAGVGRRIELGREGERAVGAGRPTSASVRPGSKTGGRPWSRSAIRAVVEVGDGDAMAEPNETDRGDQADVAGTEQEQVHVQGSPVIGLSDECPNLSIRRPPEAVRVHSGGPCLTRSCPSAAWSSCRPPASSTLGPTGSRGRSTSAATR